MQTFSPLFLPDLHSFCGPWVLRTNPLERDDTNLPTQHITREDVETLEMYAAFILLFQQFFPHQKKKCVSSQHEIKSNNVESQARGYIWIS